MMGLLTLHVIVLSICSFSNNVERSSCSSMGLKTPTLEDLTKVMSTREKIWLTMRTYEDPWRDCVYWVNNGLNSTDYDFFYWERRKPRAGRSSRGVIAKTHKHAKLESSEGAPALNIRAHWEKAKEAKTYLLLYWSASEKCFILKRHPEGGCEQFTWNSMVSKRNECDKVLQDTCGTRKHLVFKPSCIDPNAICIGFRSKC
ncbi:uncharacterized protein LOC142774480 [Rhipicephalus microplus]|uniref:uncharacterized protein LOC142774480 n=1 Tax=Rhipicephalus microplus TaxID=6941 RepID=UPI003F6D645C